MSDDPRRPISCRSNGEEFDCLSEDLRFDEPNGKDGFALHQDSKQVRIFPSLQTSDSSPFHFNTIVDYTWEPQYSYGRLIATHLSSVFIAYVVKVQNSGAVRVIDFESKERVLMKGDKGLIKDVDFLHKDDDIILGFIDEYGTFYINKIIKELKTGKLTVHPVIKVTLDGSPIRIENRRFIWCKYIPDELKEVASPKDCAYHYAVLQNDIIYAGNLVQLVQNQGEGPHHFHEIKDEFLIIDTHAAAVTDASFAPDGTALATCSKDGTVKFFQIYFKERSPARCLYSWAPHDGRPIDKVFFLDNHTLSRETASESQYWKFMVTAADNCSELKLFTCRSWECLQTIKFCTPNPSQWKLELNLTAKYLMATDIQSEAMYLLHLDTKEATARFDWVREFSMPWTTIGFNISSAGTIKFADAVGKGYEPAIMGDVASYDKDDTLNLIEINVVQPRSMQQGTVAVTAPKNYSRSRSTNGHRRISFNKSVNLLEFDDAGSHEMQVPEEVQHISLEPTIDIPNPNPGILGLPPTYSNNNANVNNRRSVVSISPATSVVTAEMTEQLNSLIGASTSNRRSRTKSPSPSRRGVTPPYATDHDARTNGSTSKTSTSSSPSREVEEILSPKSTQNFVGMGSNMGLDEPQNAIVMTATMALDGIENGNIPIDYPIHIERKSPVRVHKRQHESHSQIPQVLDKIDSLEELITAQATQIKELKMELGRFTVMHLETKRGTSDVEVIGQLLERHVKQSQSQFGRIEEALRGIENADKQRNVQAPIPSNLADLLAASIGTIVKKELDVIVPSAVGQVFEPARLNLSSQIDRLTNVVEAKLAQNINQIMQRDRIWQTLTNNFQSITKSVFESAFNEVFMESVFPRCQSAAQELLRSVNETFTNGTREYLTALEVVLEREQKREDVHELLTQQMGVMQDALSSALQVEIEAQMLRVLGGIQGGVVRQIEESLNREFTRAFHEQQRFLEAAIVPRTVTPAISVCESLGGIPVNDARANKRRVMEMARNGDVRGAFTLASSLGDADILMQLCKSYSAMSLMDLNLPSSVHLSIMQLLASDILEDTDVKIDYLNVSMLCVDTSDAKNQKGLARLIPVYQAAVHKFEERNPNSNLLSRVKVLQLTFGKSPHQLKAATSQSNLSQSSSFNQFQ